MKKLFLSGLGAALILSNSLSAIFFSKPYKAYDAVLETKALTVNLTGENTAEVISLQATAKAFDDAIVANDVKQAKKQFNYLKALIGTGVNVVVKRDEKVHEESKIVTITITSYTVNGRNSLANNVDIETVLIALGFATATDVANTNLTGKVAYFEKYLSIMNTLFDSNNDITSIKAFHNAFKANFKELDAVGGTKTVDELEREALQASFDAVTKTIETEATKSWLEGKKAKISFGAAIILLAMATGERAI